MYQSRIHAQGFVYLSLGNENPLKVGLMEHVFMVINNACILSLLQLLSHYNVTIDISCCQIATNLLRPPALAPFIKSAITIIMISCIAAHIIAHCLNQMPRSRKGAASWSSANEPTVGLV